MAQPWFASIAYSEVVPNLERLAAAGLGIEVELDDPHWLLKLSEPPAVTRLGRSLRQHGIAVNVQGPFLDLSPGSLDPFIREHTRKMFLRAVELASLLGAKWLTLYTGFNPLVHARVADRWFEIALPLWRETLEAAERSELGLLVANIFEPDPALQLRLLRELGGGRGSLGACLDAANAFIHSRKKPLAWLEELAGHLELVHLNDVRPGDEVRLPLGEGRLPLKEFFQTLTRGDHPPAVAFQMTPEEALQSLQWLRRHGLGQYQLELL